MPCLSLSLSITVLSLASFHPPAALTVFFENLDTSVINVMGLLQQKSLSPKISGRVSRKINS